MSELSKDQPEQMQLLLQARALAVEFPELSLLTDCGEYASPVDPATVGEDSLGHHMLPGFEKISLVEFNRTLACLLAMQDVRNGRYNDFVAEQTADKLTPESFAQLRDLTDAYLPDPETWQRALTHVAINDLGKTESWMQRARQLQGHAVTDHDEVLRIVLAAQPEQSPSFSRLSSESQQIILDTLAAGVSIGQILQGEASARSVEGLNLFKQRPELFRHAVMEILYDIAGARGHESQRGSKTITESTFQNFLDFARAFEQSPADALPQTVYSDYLQRRAARFELACDTAADMAIVRLCCMLNLNTPTDAAIVRQAFRLQLGESSRTLLTHHLGTFDGESPLIYYAPKLMGNVRKTLAQRGDAEALAHSVVLGGSTFAHMLSQFSEARNAHPGQSAKHLMAVTVARQAGARLQSLVDERMALRPQGDGLVAELRSSEHLDLQRLETILDLSELAGRRIVMVALGGGSDVVQGGALRCLLERLGKQCSGVISVRSVEDYVTGQDRRVLRPTARLGEAVFAVGEHTALSDGRYHEDLVARDGQTLLIMSSAEHSLAQQLRHALDALPPADMIIGVDTGGNAFAPIGTLGISRDHRTMMALREATAGKNIVVKHCGFGFGIDEVPHPMETAVRAGTQYHVLSQAEKTALSGYYQRLGLPDSSEKRFAKTLPTLLMAWQGARGIAEAPLPQNVLLHTSNAWNPFVYIEDAAEALLFTDLDKHLQAIGL